MEGLQRADHDIPFCTIPSLRELREGTRIGSADKLKSPIYFAKSAPTRLPATPLRNGAHPSTIANAAHGDLICDLRKLASHQLEPNLPTIPCGSSRIELRDETGKPIPGRSDSCLLVSPSHFDR